MVRISAWFTIARESEIAGGVAHWGFFTLVLCGSNFYVLYGDENTCRETRLLVASGGSSS